MPHVTVAICAHNAAKRLGACLEALAMQVTPPGLDWEVLVIDNASVDGTREIARIQGAKLGDVEVRVVREDRKGLIFARERAARDARGSILAFVDDDNLVEPDFIASAADFFDRHPRAGLAGGRVWPLFTDPTSKPADFEKRFADALACRDWGEAERLLIPPTDDPPPGAGLTGRRAVFRAALLGVGCVLTGRNGKRLTSGEDTEVGLIAHRLGWELWYAPTLKVQHTMPPGRLTQEYLDQLIAGGSRAQAWLDLLRGREPLRSRAVWALQAAKHELGAVKFTALQAIRRSRSDASRYAFWKGLYHGRATGYWQLAVHDPWRKLEAKLERVKQARPRPEAIAPPPLPPPLSPKPDKSDEVSPLPPPGQRVHSRGNPGRKSPPPPPPPPGQKLAS